MLLARQRGDDKARVGLARPRRSSREPILILSATTRRWWLQLSRVLPGKVLEAARRLAALLAQLGSGGKLGFDLTDQSGVARQAEQIVDALWSSHQLINSSRAEA